MIAAANPLRVLAGDAASVGDLVRTIDGPVVLVAHSYGGAVISNVPADAGEITGLVYVCGFAPDPGESCFQLAGMFPGSMLGEETSRPVPRSDGTTDLYINQDRFHDLFCPDVPAPQAARLAATQRPATLEALNAPSGERSLLARAAVVVPGRRRGTLTSLRSSSASWPSAPARSGRSRSRARPMRPPSRSPRPRPT